jgi:hypothetical protein
VLAYQLRQRGPGDDASLGDPELEVVPRVSPEGRLCCLDCGAPVTGEEQRIAIDGRHRHLRTNPAGLEFEFGCFLSAPGADVVGEPTTEFSWFSGYAWSYSLCRACSTHLGWHFAGREPPFHGLILDRLRPEQPPD